MQRNIICGVLTFSTRLDPRHVADRLVASDMEFVAAYRNDAGETVVLFSLAGGLVGRNPIARFVDKQRLDFGTDLLEASVGKSISRTIQIPM